MTLSDEDMRRIEEEEYRKLARERLERTVRLEADIRTSGDQRVEVRGVGTEMYGDAKRAAKSAARATKPLANWFLIVLIGLGCLGVFVSLLWLIDILSKQEPGMKRADMLQDWFIFSIMFILPGFLALRIFPLRDKV